jgi:hypothetical protein
VAAVTSMVLTNSAATQVENVLNNSAVIAFSFLAAVNRRELSLEVCASGGSLGSTVAVRGSTSERLSDEQSSSFDETAQCRPVTPSRTGVIRGFGGSAGHFRLR